MINILIGIGIGASTLIILVPLTYLAIHVRILVKNWDNI
jgi:hypothetical protein